MDPQTNKRILYLGGFELPDKNAAAQRVVANAKLLREMEFEVSFIGISKDIKNAPSSVDGFANYPIPYPTNTKEWIHQICVFKDINYIVNSKPDYVILYNFPAVASLRILKACHKHGIKVIHDLTEWESCKGWTTADIVRRIDIILRMRYCTKRMDGVIAISKYLYDYYKDYTNTIQVPPTVDLQDPKFCRTRTLESSDSKLKLVYAGSPGVVASKDRLDLIIKEVNTLPQVQLDIVGLTEQQYRDVFGNSVEVSKNVIFHGRVSHLEAIRFVCDADFQMLIRQYTLKNNAGFPTKFVESFSCCTPLIATVTSNICDYLQDGVNGFIVNEKNPIGNVIKFASTMSAAEKIKMKMACRNYKEFDYRAYKDEFSKLFK